MSSYIGFRLTSHFGHLDRIGDSNLGYVVIRLVVQQPPVNDLVRLRRCFIHDSYTESSDRHIYLAILSVGSDGFLVSSP